MKDILLVLIVCTFNILSFYLGLNANKEKKSNIKKNPLQQYHDYKETKINNEDYEKERKILEINLENIENYDGTGIGQKDFD